MKKALKCIILAICILFQGTTTALAEPLLQVANSQFTVAVQSDVRMNDLSGIKIDVYSAQKTSQSEGYSEYNETLAFTVTTDQTGTAVFQRPSSAFSVTVRTDSLPDGFGVDQQTRFFLPNVKNFTLRLAEIDSVDVSFEDGNAVPLLYDKNGNALSADAEATVLSPADSKHSYSVNETAKTVSYSVPVTVTAGGSTSSIIKSLSYPYETEMEKADFLYTLGFISEDAYMDTLGQIVLEKLGQNDPPHSVDGTMLYLKLRDYCEQKSNTLSDTSNAKLALQKMSTRDTTRASASVLSRNGKIRVYYDTNLVTQAVAQLIANEFQAADTMFCTNAGFSRPSSGQASDPYLVYIIDNLPNNILGATTSDSDGNSIIEINYNAALSIYYSGGTIGYWDECRGVIAHEYMHAIIFGYEIISNTNETFWMHESFANWAGVAFESDFAFSIKDQVNSFLSTPQYSLDYVANTDRVYGSSLFPISIQQYCNDIGPMKRSLEYYSFSGSPFAAINTALGFYGLDLSSAYTNCAAYNFDPDYFYDVAPGAQWRNEIPEPSYPSATSGSNIPKLACNYAKYKPIDNSLPTLTVTVDPTGSSTNASPFLKIIREDDLGDLYVTTPPLTSRKTLTFEEFGDYYYQSIGIVVGNKATAGTVSYTLTATVS